MIFAVLAQAGAIALLYWLFREAQGGIGLAAEEARMWRESYSDLLREKLALHAENEDLKREIANTTLPSIPVAIPCHEDLP